MGQNSGKGGAILTPNKLFLSLGVFTSVPILVKIDQEMRP